MSLRELRQRAGLLQADVAKKLNVAQASVSYWESGATRRISRKYHKKLAKLFHCTVDELLNAMKEG